MSLAPGERILSKVIITSAITGAGPIPTMSDYLPRQNKLRMMLSNPGKRELRLCTSMPVNRRPANRPLISRSSGR